MYYKLLLPILFFCVTLFGQQRSGDIFTQLAKPDSASGATVKVYQADDIQRSMSDRKQVVRAVQSGSGPGYRIQVFSSNVQRTAKAEAFKIEKELKAVYPETGTYVSYTSPFWKVRMGDFKTQAEAQAFLQDLIKVFPELKKTTYTVKDKVNY